MSYSLNEIEALAKNAARGTGLPWGLAQEAANATGFLCRFGLDGVGVLAALLAQDDNCALDDLSPQDLRAPNWQARGDHLNPLIAGQDVAVTCEAATGF